MSRIGRKPISVPAGVEVSIAGQAISVKGPKGSLSVAITEPIKVSKEGDVLTVVRPNDERLSRSLHGLSRTLISNAIEGVKIGRAHV